MANPLSFKNMQSVTINGEKAHSWDTNEGYFKGKVHWGEGFSKEVYQARHSFTNEIIAVAKVKFKTPTQQSLVKREINVHLEMALSDRILPLGHYFKYMSQKKKIERVVLTFPFCEFNLHNIPVTPYEKLVLLDDACTGVEQLHNAGYVHSDLKPQNILIRKVTSADGTMGCHAYVGDLGGTFKESTPPGTPIVTWSHGSYEGVQRYNRTNPEAVIQKPHDIWSLALMVHECCSGKDFLDVERADCKTFCDYVVAGRNTLAVMAMPPMINEFTRALEDNLISTLIKKSLDFDPSARPKINSFKESLRAIIQMHAPKNKRKAASDDSSRKSLATEPGL